MCVRAKKFALQSVYTTKRPREKRTQAEMALDQNSPDRICPKDSIHAVCIDVNVRGVIASF